MLVVVVKSTNRNFRPGYSLEELKSEDVYLFMVLARFFVKF